MPADRLAHYELLDKLGEGGMGALYRARDTRLNRTVALKLLRAGRQSDPDLARRLVQEARAACQLNDPHIVTIFEVDDSPGQEFIAMEYVEGEPLSARLGRGALPIDEALRIALQAAEGLAWTGSTATSAPSPPRSHPEALWPRRPPRDPPAGKLRPDDARPAFC